MSVAPATARARSAAATGRDARNRTRRCMECPPRSAAFPANYAADEASVNENRGIVRSTGRSVACRSGTGGRRRRAASLGILLLRDGNVPGLPPDALEPALDRGKAVELEAALVRNVGVGVEGDVGDRVAVADEELPAPEVALHDAERRVAERPLLLQLSAALVVQPEMRDPETHRRDVRLVAILLEEHPFEHAGPLEPIAREERCAVGEVEEDRVRLGEKDPGLALQHGDPAVR